MVHIPTRGDVPVRLGPAVTRVPDYGPSTMSADVYRDPHRFELERDRVLATHWLLACRVEQIPEAGDWFTYEGHGEVVIITRQPDGGFAAFFNVCQHRGPAIVHEERGKCARRFTCVYHNWVYDTTGAVVGVPEREDFDPAQLEGLRAPKVAVDEWAGWVWINMLGDEAPPLAEGIGPEIMADLGRFNMQDMVVHEVVEWDVPVSYKAIVDGFNEIYHAPALHNTGGEWARAARESSFHIVGDNYMCFVPRHETMDKLAQDWDHHKYAICHYVVFPNTVFNCNPRHVQVFQPIPVAVDRTKFFCWEIIYKGDMDDPTYADYYEKTMAHWNGLKRVVGEDIAIYDQLKRTSNSRAYTKHILNARECKIAHYHEQMDRKIRG